MQDQKWLDDWKTNQTFSDVATMNKKVFKEVLPQYPVDGGGGGGTDPLVILCRSTKPI